MALLYLLLYLFLLALAVGVFLYLNVWAMTDWPEYARFGRLMRFLIVALGAIVALVLIADFLTARAWLYYGPPRIPPP